MGFRLVKKTDNISLADKVFIIVVLMLLFYASTLLSFKAIGFLKNNFSFKRILVYYKISKVPDISLLPLDTEESSTSLQKTLQKPLNVFFFVSDSCPYCMKEISDFASSENAILKEFPDTKFVFCFLDDKESVGSFLKKTRIHLPYVYVVGDHSFLHKLDIKYIPAMFVINKEGYMLWRKSGICEMKDLSKLLKTYKERR